MASFLESPTLTDILCWVVFSASDISLLSILKYGTLARFQDKPACDRTYVLFVIDMVKAYM